MNQDCKYKLNDKFDVVYAEDDMFIMPNAAEAIIQEKIFTVSGIGRLIIEKIQENLSVKEIVESICEEYEVDRAIAEKDLYNFFYG